MIKVEGKSCRRWGSLYFAEAARNHLGVVVKTLHKVAYLLDKYFRDVHIADDGVGARGLYKLVKLYSLAFPRFIMPQFNE